jgi:GNAT superfamily N-acetyltransferase
LIVSNVTYNEKQAVLEFCKNTFSWGDYIGDVWDSWTKEGNFLVIHDEDAPVAICHAVIYKRNQVWIEGIRVKENFRRKGYASELVTESEKLGKQNECTISYMLIESTNKKSLDLAQKLNYENFETWNLYYLEPKKIDSVSKIKFASYEKKIPSTIFSSYLSYVNSWRWVPLDDTARLSLINQKRIIFFETNDSTDSVAIFSDSEHFDKTLLVTIISEKINGLNDIFSYIQNFAYTKNYKRVQILTKSKSLPDFTGLQYRLKFHLMNKKI